ncbi:MAG: hypothetical protein IK077_05625 [Thermoguttaceae bacterium]|nr:hypothetical protein [Thermoguttaceae bacterium]
MFDFIKTKHKPDCKASKRLWGLFLTPYFLFWALLVLLAFSPLLVLAIGGWSRLNPNCYQIESSFCEAVVNGDRDAAFKFAQAYEQREKRDYQQKLRSEKKNSYGYNRAKENEPFAYRYLYMLAYEMNDDYDIALAYEEDFPKSKRADAHMLGGIGVLPYDKARILYKKGSKKDAFIEYCRSVPSFDEGFGAEQRKITLSGYSGSLYWRSKLSCFDNYDEFLGFLDEEFEELGRPEEYADAVAKFHAVADENARQESQDKTVAWN